MGVRRTYLGRALIRTWALIQGNIVSHLGKKYLN